MTNEVNKPEPDGHIETKEGAHQFYVVSKPKVAVLFLATLGWYSIYWFYVNWRNYRDNSGEKLMPALRSIFYIFFTHSLFNKVDASLKNKQINYDWSPKMLATLFVILSILSQILERLSSNDIGSPQTDIFSIIILAFPLLILLKAQEAINLSQNDRAGISNSKFTIYNYFWIALGLVFWILIAIGLMDIFGIISLES